MNQDICVQGADFTWSTGPPKLKLIALVPRGGETIRPKAVPTTELEKKLAAELERQESEYETRLKHLRKKAR